MCSSKSFDAVTHPRTAASKRLPRLGRQIRQIPESSRDPQPIPSRSQLLHHLDHAAPPPASCKYPPGKCNYSASPPLTPPRTPPSPYQNTSPESACVPYGIPSGFPASRFDVAPHTPKYTPRVTPSSPVRPLSPQPILQHRLPRPPAVRPSPSSPPGAQEKLADSAAASRKSGTPVAARHHQLGMRKHHRPRIPSTST